jgi:hypothetical protein
MEYWKVGILEGWKISKVNFATLRLCATSSGHWAVGSALLTLSTFFSCQKEKHIESAFYHWQTELNLTTSEANYLDSLKVSKLYVKFFDVDWDESRGMAVPVASVEIGKLGNWEIIPCVFITNRTFQNIPADKIEWLSVRIWKKLLELKPANINFQEIQFDCDWTAGTRERYFQFLQVFRKKISDAPTPLSATIRLHQLRDFRETGIPPVDRGMLMLYNTGEVENWAEENSILNLEIAQNYLKNTAQTKNRFAPLPSTLYPLPLDIALPIFSWGVLFRHGSMIRLLHNLRAEDLQDTTRFLKMSPSRFQVSKSTYLDGYYLYEEDQIRTETIDEQLLTRAADLAADHLNKRDRTVAFYYLDTTTIKHFPHAVLEKITDRFKK